MATADDSVEVAIAEGVAYAKVHGRGTFKVAPNLKQFGIGAAGQGCGRVLVDMSDCRGMDSTFMGVLAGLAIQLKKRKDGELVLRNLSDKNASLISTLGLSHLVRMEKGGAGPAMPPDGQVLDTAVDKKDLAQTMITSHEVLVEVCPENALKFKDVLAYLKEDLQRSGEQNGDERQP